MNALVDSELKRWQGKLTQQECVVLHTSPLRSLDLTTYIISIFGYDITSPEFYHFPI